MATDLISSLPARAGEPVADALVKLKLAHAHGFSVLLPDVIAVPGAGFFQPKYFAAPLLSFIEGDGYVQLLVETQHGAEITIATTKGRYVRSFGDGAALYRCRIAGDLGKASGQFKVDSDSRIRLGLFHHTRADSLEKIQALKVVNGSSLERPRNAQAGQRLVRVLHKSRPN